MLREQQAPHFDSLDSPPPLSRYKLLHLYFICILYIFATNIEIPGALGQIKVNLTQLQGKYLVNRLSQQSVRGLYYPFSKGGSL